MPGGNVESLGGIGVKVVIDASDAKKQINQLPKRVEVKVHAVKDASFESIKKQLANVIVKLKVEANVASARTLRTSIQRIVEQQGGVRVPVAIQFSQAAGGRVRAQIRDQIGTIMIPVQLDWSWKNGPPPEGFTPPPGGGGGGGRPPSGGTASPQTARQTAQASERVARQAAREVGQESERRARRTRQKDEAAARVVPAQGRYVKRGGESRLIAGTAPYAGVRGAKGTSAAVLQGSEADVSEMARREISRFEVSRGQTPSLLSTISKTAGMEILGPEVKKAIDQYKQGSLVEARETARKALSNQEPGHLGLLERGKAGLIPGVTRRFASRVLSTKGADYAERLEPTMENLPAGVFAQTARALKAIDQGIGNELRANAPADKVGNWRLGVKPLRDASGAKLSSKEQRRVTSEYSVPAYESTYKPEDAVEEIVKTSRNPRVRSAIAQETAAVGATIRRIETPRGPRYLQGNRFISAQAAEEQLHIAGGSVGGGGAVRGLAGSHGGPVPVNIVASIPLRFSGSVKAAEATVSSDQLQKSLQLALQTPEGQAALAGKGPAKKTTTRQPAARETLSGTLRAQLARLTPVLGREQTEAILGRVQGPQGIDVAIQNVQEQLAAARQGLPIRSPAVSIAQAFAGGGRGRIVARFGEATQLLSQAKRVKDQENDINAVLQAQQAARDKINAKKTAGTKLTADEKKQLKTLPDDIEASKKRADELNRSYGSLVGRAQNLARLTAGEKLANLGRSFAGNITGTLGYGVALGGVTAAVTALGVALKPTFDLLTGYSGLTNKIVSELADQTKQQRGLVDVVVAQKFAQAGLSEQVSNSVRPLLTQRAALEAGNKAAQDQIDILKAANNIQTGAVGPLQTRGAIPGISTGTGGLLGSPFFQTPGIVEQLAQLTPRGTAGQRAAQSGGAGALIGATAGTFIAPGLGTLAGGLIGGGLGALLGIAGGTGQDTGPLKQQLAQLTQGAKVTGITAKLGGTDKQLEQTADTLAKLHVPPDQIAALKELGFSLVDATDKAVDASHAVDFFSEALGNLPKPSVDELIRAAKPQIQATIYGIQQNLQQELKTFNPAQRAIQNLTSPPTPFGQGIVPLRDITGALPGALRGPLGAALGSQRFQPNFGGVTGIGGKFGGVPQAAVQSFGKYQSAATQAISAIEAKAREGYQQMETTLKVPHAVIVSIQSLTSEIQGLQTRSANLSLDQQYSDYNYQLSLAKRNLGDLAGLTGRAGATEIGILQRQELLLSRKTQALSLQSQQLGLQSQQLSQQSAIISQQSNKLQLELSQRQINFQLATASFVAPGTTPEERAARIDEAKAEASYAQKQLDFQKQQYTLQQQQVQINAKNLAIAERQAALAEASFRNQIALQDATNLRAYQDQATQIQQLQKNFAIQVEQQAIAQLISLRQTERDQLTQDLSSYTSAGESITKAQAQFATEILATTGEFTTTLVSKVQVAWQQIARSYNQILGGTGGAQQGKISPGPGGESDYGTRHASGAVGMTTGPTKMTIGEAQGEAYAILKNPRDVLMPTTSAATSAPIIQILVTGNSVREDTDLEKLANLLVSKLERKLGDRASSFGFSLSR